jgi:hypothetical protein
LKVFPLPKPFFTPSANFPLWSLLHKFALLNSAGSIIIRNCLGEKLSNPYNLDYRNRADLRYLGSLDQKKLAVAFRCSEKFIDESVVSTYVKFNEIHSLTCEYLRFCRDCLKQGFHSTIFQILLFEKCPIHHKDLKASCPNCNNQIPYRLNVNAFKRPYSCPQCRLLFSRSLLTLTNKKMGKFEAREASLRPISVWLLRRLSANTVDKVLPQQNVKNIFIFDNIRSDFDVSRLITYWSDLFLPNGKLKELLSRQNSNNDLHLKTTFGSFGSSLKLLNKNQQDEQRQDLFGTEWNRELLKIYKAIGRHFIKTQLYEHLKCIQNCGRKLWWDSLTLACKGRICCAANAYLMWRMYFEGVNHPITLFGKHRTKSVVGPLIQWDPPSYLLPTSILKRIFAFGSLKDQTIKSQIQLIFIGGLTEIFGQCKVIAVSL